MSHLGNSSDLGHLSWGQMTTGGLPHVSWVVLKSAGTTGMIWVHVSCYTEGKPRLLHMADLGFQRTARVGKPHGTNTFQVSNSVMFAIVLLAKGSHMVISRVKV